MLEPFKHFLGRKKLVLASGSPRRKEILEKNLGLRIQIVSSGFEETPEGMKNRKEKFTNFSSPAAYAVETSRLKVVDVVENVVDGLEDWFLIVGADTVVEMNGKIFEKPVDKKHAFEMLKELSNSCHKVNTGVTIALRNTTNNSSSDKANVLYHSFHETSQVIMANLSDQVINAYIETGEPLDKAGSYGCQALGCSLVQAINGDFFNVMGFPAHKFSIELIKLLNLHRLIE